MHVVILGAGRVGFRLAQQLIEENRDVALVEKNPDRAKWAENLLDCLVINDEGTSPATLEKAGIRKADFFVSVTDSDEVNMLACGIVSSEFEVPHKIARSRNVDFGRLKVLSRPFLGIDFFVNPEVETSRAIVRAIERGAVSDVAFFEKSGLQMRSITVEPLSTFDGRAVQELKESIDANFLVAVIVRDGQLIIPRGDSVIRENDRIYLIAREESFDHILAHAGRPRRKVNRVVLIGASPIARYAAAELMGRPDDTFIGRLFGAFKRARVGRLTIIERDYEQCKRLSQDFPDALVINSDISDEQFSEEERLAGADVVVAASENQELNIVNAIYSKTLGAERTIALVNKSSFVHVASSLGIDVPISPVDSMVNTILKHMRRGNIRSVHSVAGGDVEVLELTIESDSPSAGRTISELRLPRQALVLSVARAGQEFIPRGDLRLEAGDDLIVITRRETVTRVEELFAA